MKKLSIIATAALTLALTTSAFANKTATRAKPRSSGASSTATTSTTSAGAANGVARSGIPGVGTTATSSSGADATVNMLVNGSATVGATSEFGASCSIGDGITLIPKAAQVIVAEANRLQINGGEGCIRTLPDAETAKAAVNILEAGNRVARQMGIQNLDLANDAQDLAVVEGLVAGMQAELGLDRPTAVNRIKGVCAKCDVFSSQVCAAAAQLN